MIATYPTFTDVTSTHAPHFLAEKLERSAVWGDYNNDGYIDLARNRAYHLEIYLNQGPSGSPAWSFGDASHEPNYEITTLTNGFNCEGLAWVDYNGDGFLDMILENHNYGVDILRNPADCSSNFYHITPNTSPLGLYTSATDGDYKAKMDCNDDGDLDLYVNRSGGNQLWRNGLNDSNYLIVEPLLDLGGGFTRGDHGANAILKSSDGSVIKGGIRDARGSFGHGNQSDRRIHFGLPDGPDATYLLELNFTNTGGERIEIDTLITPSDFDNQTFRYVRDSFGILVGLGCNLLPVDLTYFNANAVKDHVHLRWQTLSEKDNDYFTLERSNDGQQWVKIAELTGAGNSHTPREYGYIDR